MPTVKIKPGKDLQVKFRVPRSRIIEYEVTATRPVSTFILDDEGLKEFLDNRGDGITSYYGGFHRRYDHHQEIRLPFTGWGYLVVQNLDENSPVEVHYDIFG